MVAPVRLIDRSRPPRAVAARLNAAAAWAFDWDGTLIDSFARTLATYRDLFTHFGLAFDEASFRAHYAPDWRRIYRRVGLEEARWPEADRLWVSIYETEVPQLVAGAADALAALRSAGVRTAVVTAGHRARIELEMRANDLSDAFDTVIYGDEVPHQKPDPAPLQLAARYLRLKPIEMVLVGDAMDDMTMARRAEATAIGVLTGAAERGRLRKAGAHWVADTVPTVVRASGRV
jgi:HAD superfamily hydrolase (TIGR01549 family)